MSNTFKSNNRFASLIEESKNEKNEKRDINVNKLSKSPLYLDNPNNFNRPRNYYDKEAQEKERVKRELEVEKKKLDLLTVNNFPELSTTSSGKKRQENVLSFLDKLNLTQSEIIKDENFIEPGCVVISLDAKTRKPIFTYGEIAQNNDTNVNPNVNPYDVLDTLVALHVERTNDYINLWGYDEYEKEFMFQNYDYNYFDKLDEQYEEEILRNIENNKDESENEYE
jgi:hypothetical protein